MSDVLERKRNHIDIVMAGDVDDKLHCFDAYQLPYCTLPNVHLNDINTVTTLANKQLSWPFIISAMTGGPATGATINQHLAIAAERAGVALGLGSMRILREDPNSISTFDVRSLCPSIPLFANVGLVQLNYGYGVDQCNYIIDAIKADGLFFHLNALQEAVQPEGDTCFAGLLDKLATLIPHLHAPVYIKEVGNGIDAHTARLLLEIGVQAIDVAGRGGTSRPGVEGKRRNDTLGDDIRQLGRRTDQSLRSCVDHVPHGVFIAGGGLRSGVDVAKAIVMGASYGTAAAPFLQPACESPDHVYEVLMQWQRTYSIALWSCGATDNTTLQTIDFV